MLLTELEVREAFHCILLMHLPKEYRDPTIGEPPLRLKGGVNLRLFHRSPRYSEDIDFDLMPKRATKFIEHLRNLLIEDPGFRRALLKVGITDLAVSVIDGGGNNSRGFKQKLNLIYGGIQYATQIEASHREETRASEASRVPIPEHLCKRYHVPAGARIAAYPGPVAIWHKVLALSRRDPPQTRNVFDMDHLVRECGPVMTEEARALIKTRMTTAQVLASAETVAMFDRSSFEAQVAAYLPDELRNDAISDWEPLKERMWLWLEELRTEMGEVLSETPGADQCHGPS